MPRTPLGALVALVVALAPFGAPPAAADTGPVLVIEGRGFGHGVGMAQDGAYAMALAGSTAPAILSHFYPGTAIARRTATVRVGVLDAPGSVLVALPGGGEVRDAPSGAQSPGFPVTVSPGGSVRLSFDGAKYKVTALSGAAVSTVVPAPSPAPATVPTTVPVAATTSTTALNLLDPLLSALVPTTVPPSTVAPPVTTAAAGAAAKEAVSGRALWAVPRADSVVALPEAGRSYRGTIIAAGAGRGLQLTNELDVEQYLRGMGEMPASWPAAALQAQAIAARTFAIRAAAAGRTLCDDQQCQVYIGAGNETAATTAAAAATRGQVLTYRGALAETVYSASAGGMSATAEEGFGPGSPDLPYLTPVTYTAVDPQLWAMTLPLQEAGARFGYRGEVVSARVSRTGPSGRPLEITFEGPNGALAVDAHRFWAELKLRSTMFTLRTESSAPAVVDGAPLATRLAGTPLFPGDDPVVAGAASGPQALGRAPWVGLATLLLVSWATFADRATRRRRPLPAAAPTREAAGSSDG